MRKGRKQCGLSQTGMGDLLGVSPSYIAKIEKGERIPGSATGEAIKKIILTHTKPEKDPFGAPPTNRDELRALAARAVHMTLSGHLDPKRADAVTKLCQRAMGLFPEAPREDPLDQLEDPEMYEALQKELRAVEQRLVKAGHFKDPRHSKFRKAKPASKPDPEPESRPKGNGKGAPLDADTATEILKQEFADAAAEALEDWPEVE